MPGQRKSIEPLAARWGVDSQSLQPLVSSRPWDEETVWRSIRQELIPHREPLEAWGVDETAWLKQGQHAVGVSHQDCGAVGKQAHCQVSVERVVSDGGVAAPIGGRLDLPEGWAEDRERRAAAGVPEAVRFQSKPELGWALIRQALADGVPPAPVLGDGVYGDSPAFREGVRPLGMEFFLQVRPRHKAWTPPVPTERQRVRHYLSPRVPPAPTRAEIAAAFPAGQGKASSGRAAEGPRRHPRGAGCQVYLQHQGREGDAELERLGLGVDWPAGEAQPDHSAWAHFHPPPRRAPCRKLSRSRGHLEQSFQRSQDDLGLDHFEGRSWRGFHHPLVLSPLAYLFILTRFLRTPKNFCCDVATDSPPHPALAGESPRLWQLLRHEV